MQATSPEFSTENQEDNKKITDIGAIDLDFGVTNVAKWPNIRQQSSQEPTQQKRKRPDQSAAEFWPDFHKKDRKKMPIFSKVNHSNNRLMAIYQNYNTFYRHMYRKLLFLSLNSLIKINIKQDRTFPLVQFLRQSWQHCRNIDDIQNKIRHGTYHKKGKYKVIFHLQFYYLYIL